MDMEIKLLNDKFPWKKIEAAGISYSFKGDIFYKNKLLSIEELINILSSRFSNVESNNQDVVEFLKNLNGNFALVIDTSINSICIVDRVRSIPLFYSKSDKNIIISDDCYYIKDKLNNDFSEVNAVEFLLTGYVTGRETLIEGINQIQAGEVLKYNKNNASFEAYSYHQYLYKNYLDLPEEELLITLDDIFMRVFKRLIESTVNKGKQIVIPLSGGLDSRIVATFLKRLGIENVICFSYGRKDSIEVEISRQIARALGYEWRFIEYTNEKLYKNFHLSVSKNYDRYASNLVSLPHRQDFLAINELRDSGTIPGNSVIIPGHTGNINSGGHITINYKDSKDYNFELFIEDTLKKHYMLWDFDDNEKLKNIFREKIKTYIGPIDINDNESWAKALGIFSLKERQSKFILNSVRTYEYFGYEWRIPICDLELIEFFSKIPIRNKIGKQLYKKYVREKLFIKDFEPLGRIKCTTEFMKEKPIQIERTSISRIFNEVNNFFNYHAGFGRFFKYPLISLFLLRIRNCNIEFFESYPLLKFIIDTKNRKKESVNINGFQTLYFLIINSQYLHEQINSNEGTGTARLPDYDTG